MSDDERMGERMEVHDDVTAAGAGGIIGGGNEIGWPKPARPGDALRVESKVAEITPSRSRLDRGMVVMRSETLNQRGEAVQVLIAKLVVARRAAQKAEQA